MELFHVPLAIVFLFLFILSGLLAILYIFLGNFLQEFVGMTPFLNPILILVFITVCNASAFLFERFTNVSILVYMAISIGIAYSITAMLHLVLFTRRKTKPKN